MLAGRTGEIDGPARQQSQSGKESNVTPPPPTHPPLPSPGCPLLPRTEAHIPPQWRAWWWMGCLAFMGSGSGWDVSCAPPFPLGTPLSRRSDLGVTHYYLLPSGSFGEVTLCQGPPSPGPASVHGYQGQGPLCSGVPEPRRKPDAPRHEVPRPRPHGWLVWVLAFERRAVWLRSPCCFHCDA